MEREERRGYEHPLDRERMQIENRSPGKEPPISRRALALVILGILGSVVFLVAQVFFSLLKEVSRSRRRTKR